MFLKFVLGFVNFGFGWLAFLFCLFSLTLVALLYGDYHHRDLVHLNCLRWMFVSLSVLASLVLWLRILKWPIAPGVIYGFAIAMLIIIAMTLYFQMRAVMGSEWHFKSLRKSLRFFARKS